MKLIRSVRVCRTPALGGALLRCAGCGAERYQYYSCGNSHCPLCQGAKRLAWQDRLRCRMLPVPYCHITFTLPHALNGLARRSPKAVYNLLLRSAWATLKELCADEANVGGLPGATMVLHTWGSDLKYHVHAHCLVTFGGVGQGPKGAAQWEWPKRSKKLAGFRALRGVFRATFLKGLRACMERGEVQGIANFESLRAELLSKAWCVNHQRPRADAGIIEEYLGKYICRIGITHKRLSYQRGGKNVRIEHNDYARQEPGKPAPKAYREVAPLTAIGLILQHKLPRHFQRSRHYGLHAAPCYGKWEQLLPSKLRRNGGTVRTLFQLLRALLGEQPYECGQCGCTSFEREHVAPDRAYIVEHVLRGRAPPAAPAKAGAKARA